MYVKHIPSNEEVTWNLVIPAGTNLINIQDPSQIIPPYLNTLTITSSPTGYDILIDGADSGFDTPHTFNIPQPGVYSMYPPYFNWQPQSVTIGTLTEDTTVNFTASPLFLNVTSSPSGQAIYRNGLPTGHATPYVFSSLSVLDLVGTYSLPAVPGAFWIPAEWAVTADNLLSGRAQAGSRSADPDRPEYDYSIDFVLDYYTLEVTSSPAGAAIWKDGVATGQVTPFIFDPGQSGVYSLVKPGWTWAPATQTVAVLTQNGAISFVGSPPPAPSSLTATAISSSRIDLAWQDNSNNEDGFRIERKTGADGSWAQIATAAANATGYSNTALAQHTTYYYRVRAYSADVNSNYSNEANATTPYTTPAAPTNLTATAVSSSQIDLAWQDNSTVEMGFKIESMAGAEANWSQIALVAANVTSFSHSGLSQRTLYHYRVRAYNGDVDSGWSNESDATTPYTTPPAPTALTAVAVAALEGVSSPRIDLAWQHDCPVETGFRLERKTGSAGTWAQIAALGADVTSYSNTGLSHNTAYYYRVRAYNVEVNSAWSNEADATPIALPAVDFSATPLETLALDAVQFSDLSNPGSGTISSWLWEFGDGTTSTQQNPQHAYQSEGYYSVSLTVTNSFNATEALTRPDYIHVLPRLPLIAVDPAQNVDFGTVYLGTSGQVYLLITNTGSAELSVQSLSFTVGDTPFEIPDRSYPILIPEGGSAQIQLGFTPSAAGNFSNVLNIANNSVNQPLVSLNLAGTGAISAPLAPQGLRIGHSGGDVTLNWQPVTQTVAGTPVAADYYFVFSSPDPYGQFSLLGLSQTTAYTHSYVALGAPRMFYRVTAVKIYRDGLPGGLEGYLRRTFRAGQPEAEVLRLLDGLQ